MSLKFALFSEKTGIADVDFIVGYRGNQNVKIAPSNLLTTVDLDFTGDTGTGAVDLDSQTFDVTGVNGISTTASGTSLSIDGGTLQTAINTNTSNIATNTTNIATNASGISTNASGISTNASNIATNAGNISTNATNIASNTSAIATNTTNIATNTSNIASNDSDISALQSSVATNTTNIATNTGNISTNTTNIATNTSNISANATNIATNTSNISANTSAISTNTTNIATNASGISTNASAISTNTTNIATNATNIASNDTDISNLQSDVSTNTTNIATNTSNIATNATNITGKVSKVGDTMTGTLTLSNAQIQINDSGAQARLNLNNTGTGDPQINFQLGGSSKFTIGVDNTDSDKFKISAGSALGSSDRIVLDSTGNVGIGTTSPGERLTVNSNGSTNSVLKINALDNRGASRYALQIDDNDVNSRGSVYIDTATGPSIITTGNVGIGETSIDAKLHITTTSAGLVNQKFESAGSAAWRVGIPASQTYFAFDNANDNLSAPKVVIDSSGNVGIGTTSPDTKLHVEGNLLVDAYAQGEDNGIFLREGFLTIDQPSITVWDMSNSGASPDGLSINAQDGIRFRENSGEVARFKDGNFGIGTTSPQTKLDVNGAVRVGNDLTAASSANVGAIRYGTVGNSSYVDMVMQTGASTYAWVNIVTNTW